MDALSNAKRPLMTDAGLSAAVEAVAIDEYGAIRNGHVAAERALTLYLDKQELVTLMTLGTRPEMLVLGWLRNQRLIQDIEQIKAIQVDWETDSAAITTLEGIQGVKEKMARKTVTTGCGQGTVFGDLMDDLEKIELPRRSIRQSEIYRLLHTLNEYNQVYQRAGAVHGCALCSEEQIHLFIEDVGRHNAVDAIAGHMWLEETDGSDKIFYTTGRLTSEMVIKVAQMGIPVLLSRSGITQMGLELARKVGVTLIARAKGRHFLVYNGADQISFDAVPEIRPQKSGARQAGQSKSR
ncbi:MAG: formate dehydrogenase accessory sulfurtransferase FdhD [Candidatus Thiodiazotropha sp. (ex Codakia orbicularis)]|nr:formate dehydrogenase accessory sulfurtransferase FdhD [Candidatus Thiodiazotropha sp. (ex Codakia orbicularis)]